MIKSYRPSPDALLNPRYDENFKAIFTDNSPEAKIALTSFLEAFLEAKVSDVKIIENEFSEESVTDKQAQFDVSCILNDSEYVNIEMQGINESSSFDRRAEYYAAHLLNHNVRRGMAWKDVPKVYQISVLNFKYDTKTTQFFSRYRLQTEDLRGLSDRMNIIFIELPKLLDENEDASKLTAAQKWGKFFLYADKSDKRIFINSLCKTEDGLMAAEKILKKISQDEINWYTQMSRDKFERDRYSAMMEAVEQGLRQGIEKGRELGIELGIEKGRELGMEIGMEQGIEQGRTQGIEIGIEKGREQGIELGLEQGIEIGMEQGKAQGAYDKTIETAKNFLKMGLSVEQVSQGTGLSLEEVESLK